MSDPRSIVIIGAGECGVRAALTLRVEGYTGEIALIHGEAVEPYERPPLSKPGTEDIFPKQQVHQSSSREIRFPKTLQNTKNITFVVFTFVAATTTIILLCY